eukprot:CAMPEP_0114164864 /NCGR_PEP_ID=MMETSP0043_2-20121206/30916_1 /TAXON_ID=464988 /ORGANISM="Hemiselmis andersenii, Strain CCMP644" /LENGTH=60 /DNA_ID=CAMNT_0001261595 /DNA_START=20 /DNA_END=198 /DNA_ORIENTATION=+
MAPSATDRAKSCPRPPDCHLLTRLSIVEPPSPTFSSCQYPFDSECHVPYHVDTGVVEIPG